MVNFELADYPLQLHFEAQDFHDEIIEIIRLSTLTLYVPSINLTKIKSDKILVERR